MVPWSFLVVFGVAFVLWYALGELQKDHQALQAQQAALRKDYETLHAKYMESQRILAFNKTLTTRLDASKRECFDRLNQLGFQFLEDYLRSDLWQKTKRRYRSSDYPQRFIICGASDYQLHHRTYARLGGEELFDLLPLCSVHHQKLHDLLDLDTTLCVKDTHDCLTLLVDKECVGDLEEQGQAEGTCTEGRQYRSRAGKPWSAEEDEELLRCTGQSMAIEDIAERLHRGVKAIEVRWVKLGSRSVKDTG